MNLWREGCISLGMTLGRLAILITMGAVEAMAESPKRRLIISIPDRKIAVVEDGKVMKVYDVAVGKDATPTPAGAFKIANRVEHPTWYGPKQVVPPGKANPLGTRWMGLGFKGYGIHGTNVPRSIGHRASHGCIRMRNADVEELFAIVAVGDEVEITDDAPVMFALAGGGM
jgi:lipoprotein-anchoring transpeptidase ErfK/SrfK